MRFRRQVLGLFSLFILLFVYAGHRAHVNHRRLIQVPGSYSTVADGLNEKHGGSIARAKNYRTTTAGGRLNETYRPPTHVPGDYKRTGSETLYEKYRRFIPISGNSTPAAHDSLVEEHAESTPINKNYSKTAGHSLNEKYSRFIQLPGNHSTAAGDSLNEKYSRFIQLPGNHSTTAGDSLNGENSTFIQLPGNHSTIAADSLNESTRHAVLTIHEEPLKGTERIKQGKRRKRQHNRAPGHDDQGSQKQPEKGHYRKEEPLRRLNPAFAPNIGHIVWCGTDRWFEFHHYISALSLIKTFQPDIIYLYYEQTLPKSDKTGYNTWYWELTNRFPYFRAVKETSVPLCREDGRPRYVFIKRILNKHGGVFLSENTILTGFPMALLENKLLDGFDRPSGTGIIVAHKNIFSTDPGQMLLNSSGVHRQFPKCVQVNSTQLGNYTYDFSIDPMEEGCITVYRVFFPKDIMVRHDSFGRLIRRLFYGTEEIVSPKASYDKLIPNIAHIVWVNGRSMRFLFYLTCLSLIYIQQVDRVYIYGGTPPKGRYWERLRGHPKVAYIHRTEDVHIFNSSTITDTGHISDIWRIDLIYKYGGIYTDTDVLFVKKIEHRYMGYDAIGSFDWPKQSVFPDKVSLAPTLGKPGAKFYSLARQTWHHYNKDMPKWNGLLVPYKLWERHPDLLLIEPHLQVICAKAVCHPTWYPGYQNGGKVNHLTTSSLSNWKQDAHAFHITMPGIPPEFKSERALFKHSQRQPLTLYAEVGKYVMEKCGMWRNGKPVHKYW